MLSIIKYAFVGSVGVAAGILIGQYAEPIAVIEHARTAPPIEISANSDSPGVQANNRVLIKRPFSFAAPTKTDDAKDVVKNERPKALEFIDGVSVDLYGTSEFEQASAKFGDWLASSEYPARDILSYLSSNAGDDQKYLLEYLVSAKYHAGLDLDIVNELGSAQESDVQEWASILQLVPITSSEGRDALIDVLPSLGNKDLVAASISAVTPSLISPIERDTLLSSLSTYADSDDATVRTAALGTLGSWSATDYSYIFEEALVSDDDDRIQSVLSAVKSGSFITPPMQSQLFSILGDSAKPMHLRHAVFDTLAHAQLSEEEYWQYYDFSENQVEPVNTQ